MRVSTEAQAEADRNSLPVQRAEFSRYCTERGYEPVAEYSDTESGRTVGRASYQQMIRDARTAAFDVIVVRFIDRFGRDEREILRRILELEELGVAVESIEEDVREFIFLALTAWKAGQESKRIAERVKKTMHYAVAHDVPMGRAPYGYRREDKKFLLVEREAAVVRDIFRWCADENMGVHSIATRLNLTVIPSPTGGIWFDSAIKKVLGRRIYTGDYVWGESERPGLVPQVITHDLFERAQKAMQRRLVMSKGQTQKSDFLLSGLLVCGYCGSPLNGSVSRVKERHTEVYRSYPHYLCAGRRKWKVCDHWNRHDADTIERGVLDYLRSITTGVQPPVETVDASALTVQLRNLDRQQQTIQKRLAANLDVFHAGALTMDQLRVENERLAKEQAGLEVARTEITRQLEDAERRQRDASLLPSRLQALDEALSEVSRQRAKGLLQQIVERVTVFDDGQPAVIRLR
jgi:site-specific DNA recombinase